ncbi:hypothetical protein ACOMICROBIO_GDFFDHBD_00289 [Vibrio sp. B1REV9]|nr:hypothetical protein ACOMICROBIO_GDFFDHBD_00289 [Vibrio sp. B1REV9]
MKTKLIARTEHFAARLLNLVNTRQAGGHHDV